jgi:transcriptional regulator with XRE-family HTH domain
MNTKRAYRPRQRRFDPEKIASARAQRGWSQTELAARSGFKESTISKIEKGERGSEDTIKRLAQVMNVPVSSLMRDQTAA